MDEETKEELVEDIRNTSKSIAGGMFGKFIDSVSGDTGLGCAIFQHIGDVPKVYKFVKNKINDIKNKKKQNGEMNDKNEG